MHAKKIVEVKHTLSGTREEYRCLLLERSENDAVLLYRLTRTWRVSGLELHEGAMTLAYYWTDRPYNVYHWHDPDGGTLGVYFNISDNTRIESKSIHWRDLAVDLLVYGDGRPEWLDEDELPDGLERPLRDYVAAAKSGLRSDFQDVVAEIKERSAVLWPRAVRLDDDASDSE
jgi:predicted RNA-binding protein associated with RNAse of E/G family